MISDFKLMTLKSLFDDNDATFSHIKLTRFMILIEKKCYGCVIKLVALSKKPK